MNKRIFLGIDVDAASVRAGLFDAAGYRLVFAVRPIAQFYPHALYVEQSYADLLGGS